MGTMVRAFLAVVLLGACAQVPQRELHAYRDAFSQANQAAQEVLLDYDAASQEHARRMAETPPAQPEAGAPGPAGGAGAGGDARAKPKPAPTRLYPERFVPASTTQPNGSDVEQRLRALAVIDRYNTLLADLAEGKSASEAAASARGLISALQAAFGVVPGLDAFVDTLASAAAQARARQQFVVAVKEGEKPVTSILDDVLKKDAASFYQLRRALAEIDQNDIVERWLAHSDALRAVVASHAFSADPEPLNDAQARLDASSSKAGSLINNGQPIVLKPGPGGAKAADDAAEAAINEHLLAIERETAALLDIAARMKAYHQLLERYVQLLDGTKSAMVNLRVAVDRPQDVMMQFEDLTRTALALRRDFIKVRANF
ncbi:MAG TPA: hypothetical protein VFU53_02160 [Burkholderiales bacterium]|nr:hypothetical protein [Burkholderiales bacterium]